MTVRKLLLRNQQIGARVLHELHIRRNPEDVGKQASLIATVEKPATY
jgi:hypothetical protein